ncbi:MAG: hypothetical protein HY884_09065 [Deltaproteobacteria bacterium]|nr:hypothetical protein [Deltaproteobacteria bacterium]
MALINSPEAAYRLARTIISDIALYNKDKISNGIKNDNIFDLLEKELEEGLNLYKSRIDPAVDVKLAFYNKAIVDILIKKSGDIKSGIW